MGKFGLVDAFGKAILSGCEAFKSKEARLRERNGNTFTLNSYYTNPCLCFHFNVNEISRNKTKNCPRRFTAVELPSRCRRRCRRRCRLVSSRLVPILLAVLILIIFMSSVLLSSVISIEKRTASSLGFTQFLLTFLCRFPMWKMSLGLSRCYY